MRSRKGQWKADFPMREEVEDYAGSHASLHNQLQ